MLAKPYRAALLCMVFGLAINLWGCRVLGSAVSDSRPETTERKAYGFMNIFVGLGIVVLAARYARKEHRLAKEGPGIAETATCPRCHADLGSLASLRWKSWTVSRCAACNAPLKGDRTVAGLAFLVGSVPLLTVALPMITGKTAGGWVCGSVLFLVCPAAGFWLLLNCSRYEGIEEKASKPSK